MDRHRLDGADFAALAAGTGSHAGLAVLARAQLSRHLLLLRAVLRAAPEATGRQYAVLAAAQERAPGRVRALLAYPHVGAWAANCLAALRAGRPADAAGARHLAAVAAAAAVQAGLDAVVEVPVLDGLLVLPTLGAVAVRGATARVDAGAGTVHADGRTVLVGGPGWRPLRRLTAEHDGLRLSMALDDLDPYRAHRGLPVTGRLTDHEAAGWQELLIAAWRLLVRRHRPYAEGLAGGLAAVVPLRADGAARGVSATARDAFGAVAISRPADPRALAIGLVHEFQHAKLNAVQYLIDLHEPTDERVYSPWRDDPRPVGGLLHGAYAYLAVTELWRVERDTGDRTAAFEFARWRAAVDDAVRALLDGGRLTAAGRRFVAAMGERTARWRAEAVPPEIRDAAGRANTDHRLQWRLRHVPVPAGAAAELAAAWLGNRAAGPLPPPGPARPAARSFEANRRLDLVHDLLRDPGDGAPEPDLPGVDAPAAVAGDRAYARGEHDVAAAAYRRAVADRPDDVPAWAGLALTAADAGALHDRPELVAAVYRAVLDRGGPAPDPVALAAWLTP